VVGVLKKKTTVIMKTGRKGGAEDEDGGSSRDGGGEDVSRDSGNQDEDEEEEEDNDGYILHPDVVARRTALKVSLATPAARKLKAMPLVRCLVRQMLTHIRMDMQ
jgi:hypothetical protein